MPGMTSTLFDDVPLKDMDPAALVMTIMDDVGHLPVDGVKVSQAISAASFLHLHQTRANRKGLPRTSYIEHPLRGALRALRWGVESEAVIVGIILHDTVEDCLDRLLNAFVPGVYTGIGEEAQRELAYTWISTTFGSDASALVRSLTNPPATRERLTKDQKRERYAAHVQAAIAGDAEAFIGKFTDFMDNAGGLHHNAVEGNEGMIAHLSRKYFPVVALFKEELDSNYSAVRALVSAEGYADIEQKLGVLETRLGGLQSRTP